MKIDLPADVIKQILQQDSKMLATHIVVNRILGSFREEAKLAMAELMRRRMQNKDDFKFEEFIKNEVQNTNIDLKMPTVQEIKKEIIGSIIGQMFHKHTNEEFEESIDENIDENIEEPPQLDAKTTRDLQEVFEQLKVITSS